MREETKGTVLTPELVKEFKQTFQSDKKNLLALNACVKTDPFEICVQRRVVETTNHVFTHKVDSETKPVTNQKNAGTCWIFAALNVIRVPFVKQFQLDDFEFSQSYIFFWDKIMPFMSGTKILVANGEMLGFTYQCLEKCNYFLNTVVEVLKRGEDISGRLMSFLLHDPIADGGQWDMLVNIVKKYGVVPKKCYPDVFCSETSSRLNYILKSKLREFTRDLNVLYQQGSSDEQLRAKIQVCMEELFRVISICLGMPPEVFTWEYYDKNKSYCTVGPITPQKFYADYVKPYCDVESKVCFVHDPREENPYEQTYTVDCLGNMVGGQKVVYLNLEVDQFLKYAVESIKHNEPVWFGCEVNQRFGKIGIQDMNLHDFKLVFGTDVKNLSKAEKLHYGDSAMNHAMVLTAVSLDEKGEPVKWRVENSWGDDRGDKGYLVMTTDWFREVGYEVVVDKQYVPKEVLEMLKKEPKVLPAWDPMGSLAMVSVIKELVH